MAIFHQRLSFTKGYLSPKAIFRFAAYILFLTVLTEVGSRIFWRMTDTTWGLAVPQHIGRIDSELGWSLLAGSTADSKVTGTRVHYTINSLGLRGGETTLEKPAGTFRIVVLGDSHTFGFGIPLEQHFTTLLQGYFKNVEVLNLGVCGYGVDQMYLRLQRDGFLLHPDLVICYVPHFGDFRHLADKLWGVGKPRFINAGESLELTNHPVTNNSKVDIAALEADRFLSNWSRAYEILRNTVYAWAIRRPQDESASLPAMDKKIWADAVDLGWRIVKRMETECRERETHFVLATQLGEIAIEAEKAGTPTVFTAFALRNPRLSLTRDPFHHPNEAANGVLAWELSKYLKSKEIIPKDFWLLPF